MICDTCANWGYDEEFEDFVCQMDLDEDEVYRFYASPGGECRYYRNEDEYAVVRHQM